MKFFSSIAVLLLSSITLSVAAPVPRDSNDALDFVKRTPEYEETHLVARSPNVKMTGGGKAVLAKSGFTDAHYGGKDPIQHHVDHVTAHLASNPALAGYTKAAITAPYHEGGKGGGGHPPDMTNHATVIVSGKGVPKKTIHVPAPAGAPAVPLHHFNHKRELEELVARAHGSKSGTNVYMTGGAKQVLANSGLSHTDFGGKDPKKAHVDHVKAHIASDPHLSKYTKAAITAPYHEGGKGGGKYGPDPTNHATVRVSGGGQKTKTIHVPAPAGAPKVESHHFGHKRDLEEETHLFARGKTNVKMTGGAKQVLSNSGLSHSDFGGKDPVKSHVDHVKNHMASDPKLAKYTKAAITAPYHQGGKGGGGHAPDPTNHATVRISGGGQKAKTIHVPAPAGAPSVASHHFGHP